MFIICRLRFNVFSTREQVEHSLKCNFLRQHDPVQHVNALKLEINSVVLIWIKVKKSKLLLLINKLHSLQCCFLRLYNVYYTFKLSIYIQWQVSVIELLNIRTSATAVTAAATLSKDCRVGLTIPKYIKALKGKQQFTTAGACSCFCVVVS